MAKEKIKRIKIGTEVTWSSAGRGAHVEKSGVVKKFIPAGESLFKHIPKSVPQRFVMSRNDFSALDRYLVFVDLDDDSKFFYAPKAATLEAEA